MKDRKIMSVIWIILGAILIGLAFVGKVDEFWNGIGSALAVVGTLQLLRFRRFNKNEAYREKVEIECGDERLKYIRLKAWGWAGYLYVIITGVMVIVFKIIGQDLWSFAASAGVIVLLLLFWVSYMVLKKKY